MVTNLKRIQVLTALAFLVAVAVYIKNAWICEDAYIIFRSLEQFFAGHGPVWNPHERVQVFTSPLWYGLLAFVRVFSANVFLTTLGLGLVMWLACLATIRRLAGSSRNFLLIVVVLLASNGLSDFTSSGLENPLLYLLLALFLLLYRKASGPDADSGPGALAGLWFVAGLILLTRLDHLFLVVPAVAGATWQRRASLDRRAMIRMLVCGLGPVFVWTIFAVVYYGFPVPNTAYAKLNTGIDGFVLFRQGVKYFLSSLGFDTITMIGAGAFVWWGWRAARVRWLAVGVALQLAYVVGVGGDFMQGRFLAGPYLVAVVAGLALTDWNLTARRSVWIGLILYTVVYPHTPVNAPPRYPIPEITLGVIDERGVYNDEMSLWQYLACRRDGRDFPDMSSRRDAVEFRKNSEPVIVRGNIGVFGYFVGTDKIIVDSLALSDPLLARLPTVASWRVGHYRREIPGGYVASLQDEKSGELEDALLQEMYADLILITRSRELFTAARWGAIVRQNLRLGLFYVPH